MKSLLEEGEGASHFIRPSIHRSHPDQNAMVDPEGFRTRNVSIYTEARGGNVLFKTDPKLLCRRGGEANEMQYKNG